MQRWAVDPNLRIDVPRFANVNRLSEGNFCRITLLRHRYD